MNTKMLPSEIHGHSGRPDSPVQPLIPPVNCMKYYLQRVFCKRDEKDYGRPAWVVSSPGHDAAGVADGSADWGYTFKREERIAFVDWAAKRWLADMKRCGDKTAELIPYL